MKLAQDIIIKPIITEKSMDLTADKKYVFKVDVKSVNTINMKKKPRRLRYSQGYTAAWKKAIVTLEPGSKTIEFFEGLN